MGRTYRARKQRKSSAETGVSAPVKRDFVGNLSGDANNIALIRELRAQGFENETRLMPAQFGSTGRGVYSTRPIRANDVLIEMPFRSLVTLATLEDDADFQALLAPGLPKLARKLSIQNLLALYVLHRQHRNPADAFIGSIPTAFTNPLFCGKAELMLLPDHLFERIHQQNQDCIRALTELATTLADQVCACCSRNYFPDIFTAAAFKWAYFVVNSRSVFIDPANVRRCCISSQRLNAVLRDSPNTALAPFFDLMNHSDAIDAQQPEFFVPRNCTDTAALRYTLRTSHPFRAHEQICISYGPLDNARLLLEYGFVLRTNRHDCVRLSLEDITAYLEEGVPRRERKPLNSNRFKFVKENALDGEMFVSRADGLSHSLVVVLTILFVETLAHYSNVLSVVGFGRVLPVEPVAQWARKVLLWKRAEFERVQTGLAALPEAERSASGAIVVEYVEESVRLIDDVVAEYLPEE